MFKDGLMPLVLTAIIAATLWQGQNLNYTVKAFSYALSLSIKEILIFILPIIIFTFVLRSLYKLGLNAIVFVLLLIPMIVGSNFLSTCLAYKLGGTWLEYNCFTCKLPTMGKSLQPLWNFVLPHWIDNSHALIAGLVTGIFLSRHNSPLVQKNIENTVHYVELFLSKVFTPLIPLFVFGFILNLQEDGVLSLIVEHYTSVMNSIIILCFGYIILVYGCLQGFKLLRWGQSLKTMLPAALTGFSTMSSAAAMPLTIMGTLKSVEDPTVVRTVIPATVNVHLIGDCFAIPIFALALMISFDQGIPEFSSYLVFACYFVLAKFSVAAIPGGGILVMLPVLQQYLNFTPEMLPLITALYILFDPIITTANILGNGAFAQLFTKIYQKIAGYNNLRIS